MTHPLRQSPSLVNNNLTCSGTLLAFAKGNDVIVTNYGDNKTATVPFSDKSQVFGLKYLDFASLSCLAVGMADGFQIWSAEGTRLLFFHAIRPTDEAACKYARESRCPHLLLTPSPRSFSLNDLSPLTFTLSVTHSDKLLCTRDGQLEGRPVRIYGRRLIRLRPCFSSEGEHAGFERAEHNVHSQSLRCDI